MATAPVMDNPLTPQLSPQPQMQKIVQDVIDCIFELKRDFVDNQVPINDDNQTLQRFCAKLEHLLQADQKPKTSFLGAKKDYWNYFIDCLQSTKGLNDGIKYVKSIAELKTMVGRGRALIRFALMHQRLADTLQACVMNGRVTSDWYNSRSIWLKHKTTSAIINALYDLNDVQFDLAPRGYDLDASWPSFARKTFGSPFAWNPPSRSSSVSSLTGLGQDFPTLKLDTSNMSETSSLREDPYESLQNETDLYLKLESLEAQLGRMHEKDTTWKDKEKQWEESLHCLKNLNAEQEINVKSLVDDVTRKTSLLVEKEASMSRLNTKVDDLEHRNSDLMTKVEGLIEEKSSGVSSKMDSANKAHEFLENLNDAERRNNALLLENAELKGKVKVIDDEAKVATDEVKVTKEELVSCQSDFESRRQELETELLQMTDLKSDFEKRMENAIQELAMFRQGFGEKEKTWLETEKVLSKRLTDFGGKEKELSMNCEQMRLDNVEFQSRLSRKNAVIEKQEQSISDLKYEIQEVTKRLENVEALKEEKESELGRALQASQTLNSEIKREIEQLKLELQEREGSVEREITSYSEKLRVLEEEKDQLQTRIETGDKERVEKQNLEMKLSDLETDKTNMCDQVKMLEDDRNHYFEALQKSEAHLEERQQTRAALEQTIKELEDKFRDAEGQLKNAEKSLKEKSGGEKGLKSTIDELQEKLSHLELNLSSSECELDERNRSSSDLEGTVKHLRTKVQDLETKLDGSDASSKDCQQELLHLQKSLSEAVDREQMSKEEVEGLRSLVMLLDHEDLDINQVKELPNVSEHLVAKVEYILQEKQLNDSKVRHAEAENIELRTQVKTLKQQTEEYANELQHCQLENAELKTVICGLENVDADTSRKLEMRMEIIEEQTAEIQKLEVKMQEGIRSGQNMEADMSRLEASTSDAVTQVEELQKENLRKEVDMDNLRADIMEQINQIEKLRVMINEMDAEISGRDQRISQLDVVNKRLANEMKLLQDLVATANDSSTRFEKQIRSFEERITVMSSSFESLQHDNERLLSDKGRLMQDNSRLQSQVETVTGERKRLEDEQDMLEKSLIAAFEEKLAIAENQRWEENERCAVLQKQLDEINGDKKSGDRRSSDLSGQLGNEPVAKVSKSDNSTMRVENDNMQKSGAKSVNNEQIQKTIANLKTELQSALDENRELSTQVDGLKETFKGLKQESVEYKQTVTSLQKERDDVKAEFTKLNSVIENICEENKQLKKVLSDRDNEVVDLSQMISDLEEEKVKLTRTMLEMHTSREELENDLEDGQNSLHAAQLDCKELRVQLDDLRLNATTESENLQEKCGELVFKMLDVTNENETLQKDLKENISSKEEMRLSIKDLTEKLERDKRVECLVARDEANIAMETGGEYVAMVFEENIVAEGLQQLASSPDDIDGDESYETPEEDLADCQQEDVADSQQEDDDLKQSLAAITDEVKVVEDGDLEAQKVKVGGEDFNVDQAALIESLEDEILALKQQNYDMEISLKCYVNQGMDVAKMLDRMTDQETLIQTLEFELQEIRDEREIEREKQWNELGILKDTLMNREDESKLLGEELKRTSLILDDERETAVKLKNEMLEMRKKYEERLSQKEQELLQEVSTSVELKKKLIKLIKEKDTLWQRSDKLEFKNRIKAAETWMNDTDVTQCLGCRSEFSFMVRKHHCRLCGRIYCHNCSNNYVLTTHTKGKSRVCNACFIERESGSQDGGGGGSDIEDDASVQVPNLRSDSWRSFNSTPEPVASSSKVQAVNVQTDASTPNCSIDSMDSSPRVNYLDPAKESLTPSPDVHMIITRDPQNKTDDSKLQLVDDTTPGDFQATTDDLTSSVIKVEVDGDEIDGDKDDVFHLISDEEVARSLSHSHSEYLAEHENSLTTSVTLSVDAISKSMQNTHEETTIRPGHMFAVPILIDSPGIILCWEFSTDPKSITFSINYKERDSTPPDQQQVLFNPCKCNSHRQVVQGEMVAQKAGVYTLYFDNASSRYTSKNLKYKLQIKTPTCI